MIKVDRIDVWGFKHAVRGMRNPLNSWNRSDSDFGINTFIGKNDLDLMRRLYKAGPEHRKYLRQIFVSMDITAPLYWWKEFDTYKIGTTANSCSTMHKIAEKEFTLRDFSCEHLVGSAMAKLSATIDELNFWRNVYIDGGEVEMSPGDVKKLEPRSKIAWWQMIQLLPSSYDQKRTITMNYENVISIIHQREGHKLDEWHKLREFLLSLPYVSKILEVSEENGEN